MNLIEALNNSKKYRLKKSKIESKILDKADTIIEYLIKCFIWKNSTEELDLWCLKISDAL